MFSPAEREMNMRSLVAMMPGETHNDRLISAVLYIARELEPSPLTTVVIQFENNRQFRFTREIPNELFPK